MNYTLEQLNKMMDDNGGNLDLEGCTSITALPEGLTVAGFLDLRGTSITALPEGLTVAGDLDLRGTSITALPEGLTVAGYLDLRGTSIENADTYCAKKLHNGDYVPGRYLYADGILTHVKRKKTIMGGKYTFYVGKIKGKNVISDGENYAHCSTIRDGIADLEFKKQKDRGTDRYTEMTTDSTVTYEEAIVMYRIITGACRQGTQSFLDTLSEAIKRRKSYTVGEIIELTKGQYGAESFRRFFEGRE